MNEILFGAGSLFFSYLEFTARLILALILGGIIGYQRESLHRPAGFRTHTLVCVGAALVMITSEFIFLRYSGSTNADPARLGAQVISGIGFLGAGTIIREGFSVKGLTTAASLWAVSCVGIAVGIGFYEGAIAATVLIYITLISLKMMEKGIQGRKTRIFLYIHMEYEPGKVDLLKKELLRQEILIRSIEFIDDEGNARTVARIFVQVPDGMDKQMAVDEVLKVDGVKKVYEF